MPVTRRSCVLLVSRFSLLVLLMASCSDTVTDPIPVVDAVVISPDSLDLLVGSSQLLDIVVRDAAGAELAADAVQWITRDAQVASVDGGGRVEAKAPGRTVIVGEVGGKRDSTFVRVRAPLPNTLSLELISDDILATHAASPPGDARLFLTTMEGLVLVLSNGALSPEPFLDLRSRVKGGVHGLYSIAFHPEFATNGYFFVAFVDPASTLRVERYTAGASSADPQTGRFILGIDHPPPFDHFGGWIGFGPDGMLYITSGDGGPGNSASAQDESSLLGKLLRIDVDNGDPYSIPAGNPFIDQQGARPEIWAVGLRNPWRASIDAESGLIYIADVGQDSWEEVNVSVLEGGLNYGWDRMEGTACYPASTACDPSGLTLPLLAYPLTGSEGEQGSSHPSGCSITGGSVYRGSAMPALRGHYFYADFCAGWIRSFRVDAGAVEDGRHWFSEVGPIISFGVDAAGELYVFTLDRKVYRIAPGEP